MKDPLGDRMKRNYENVTRFTLPRRTHTIIRLDGRSFHTYTRQLTRPFDHDFHDNLVTAAMFLCREAQGCKLAFVQSDEISLVLTDYDTIHSEPWFGGVVQKIASVAAGTLSSYFNYCAWVHRNNLESPRIGVFDARVFAIPQLAEVLNYLVWRQADATRNSISMTGAHHLGHKTIDHKSTNEIQDMLWREKGVNWNDMPESFKRGTLIYPQTITGDVTYVDKRTGQMMVKPDVERRRWFQRAAPIFTGCRDELREWITPSPTEDL